ncbi:MAG TPA: GNAT family N-acetyltransferase [Blastocatellia bacterium]|nr:GNAT family N-acetyltransferase [Blastocatellia bacterium]
MRIEVYNDSKKNIWDEFIARSKNGTFLFLRDYMDYHRDRFTDHSLLICDDESRLAALLPANIKGTTFISHGGLTYGGFITDAAMKAPKMLRVFEAALLYLKSISIERFIYKTIPHIYHGIPAEEDRYALYLCDAKFIRRGVLAVIDARQRLPFQDRRRRGADKAVKNGLVVRQSGDFAEFWEILKRNLKERYNTIPVHSLEEITVLHSRFPDNIKLFGCYKGEELIGGVVIYESQRVAHVQYIAASDAGRQLGALDLIFSSLVTEVYNQKPFFDFGTSDEDDGYILNKGLIDQKEGFGARVIVHDHYEIRLSEWEPTKIRKAIDDRANSYMRKCDFRKLSYEEDFNSCAGLL